MKTKVKKIASCTTEQNAVVVKPYLKCDDTL